MLQGSTIDRTSARLVVNPSVLALSLNGTTTACIYAARPFIAQSKGASNPRAKMAATQEKIICGGICEQSIVTLLHRGSKRQIRSSINETCVTIEVVPTLNVLLSRFQT